MLNVLAIAAKATAGKPQPQRSVESGLRAAFVVVGLNGPAL